MVAALLSPRAEAAAWASHLKARFGLTLSNRSPGMLRVSRALNPGCEHLVGKMRTLRLARRSPKTMRVLPQSTYASERIE
jgi:hypothetical protein